MRLLAVAALFAWLAPPARAHTWIEEYQVIGSNGSYIGDRGFSRGYTARTDADFDGDANILWLLPQLDARLPDGAVRLRVNSSDSLCHPNQRTSNYSNPAYPKLKAAPGNFVAMKYLENGHVTLPWNQPGKPHDSGTVLVFATTKPIEDEKIVNVLKWNREGTGGDGRGWLLSAQDFDDGRCHQINSCTLSVERQALYPNMIPQQNVTAEQWCESDIQIPTNLKPGSLTTYWVWQWPTEPGTECVYPDGKDEYYTACADFDIVGDSPGDVKIADEVATNTLVQENFQTKAVSTYFRREAYQIDAVTLENWNMKAAATTPTVNSAWSASCSSVLMAMQADPNSLPPLCPSGKWATGTLSNIVAQQALNAAKTLDAAVATTFASPPPATAPPIATGGPAQTGGAAPEPGTGAQAPGSTGSSSAAPQPGSTQQQQPPAGAVVTVTTYFTTVTATAQNSGGAGPSSPAAGSAAAGDGLSTVRTVTTAAAGAPPAAGITSSPANANAPYVGASGIVEEGVGRYAGRAHARQFA